MLRLHDRPSLAQNTMQDADDPMYVSLMTVNSSGYVTLQINRKSTFMYDAILDNYPFDSSICYVNVTSEQRSTIFIADTNDTSSPFLVRDDNFEIYYRTSTFTQT
ncbi:hypothetical protein OAO87_04680, partial [bacterium]|nr:hypothetical protein [bacterium]